MAREREEISVARDKSVGARICDERHEVVIVVVACDGLDHGGVWMRLCGTLDVCKKLEGGVGADEPPKLGARQDITCLLEEHRAHDQPELSGQSQPDQSTRHTTGADRSRHDDVGVDDDPEHLRRRPARSLGSGSPQLGYRQLHRLVVIEGNSCRYLSVSDLVEHAHATKPEVTAQSFFDDLVLGATVLASGSTESVEDALVDLHSGRAPGHVRKRTSDAYSVSAGLRPRRGGRHRARVSSGRSARARG